MTKFVKKLVFSLACLTLNLGNLQAALCGFDFKLDTGYAWERINESTELIDSAAIVPYSSSQKQFKSLQVYLLGGKAQFAYCDWILKAKGHYGWILDGNYNDNDLIIARNPSHSHTADGSAALGYKYPISCCFSVVPFVGYSYDLQHVRIHDVRSFDEVDFPILVDPNRFRSSWYGPWVGFDLLFNNCANLFYNIGYEFHYGRAHTRFHGTLTLTDTSFNYTTRINNMIGHVFHFDVDYAFACDWLIGLSMQYTYWGNNHSRHNRFSDTVILTPTQSQRTFDLNWHAAQVTVSIGKAF